ncbi:hypothetical protein I7Z51_002497 [Vibrio parahaemolyticus]|uniref:hypothetical protein n=1 Tax=Vibrio TaxID=662 RepID=UPI001A8D3291|nr:MULTISPECIES: hypothetical protein [Vibrio]EGQ7973574.1 hypothetical protein [Vibrio parahaemolyticus]MBO0209781.1 hypothetical protein [Vibrio sp. Vb0877]MCR9811843.1 hypothetical protein [Vibrio parahaemolyticus]MDW2320297.1 hypothetical protein [Vibrio sp. 1159]
MAELEAKKKPLYFVAGLCLLGLAVWASIYFWHLEEFHLLYIDAAILFAVPIGLSWLRWSNFFKHKTRTIQPRH